MDPPVCSEDVGAVEEEDAVDPEDDGALLPVVVDEPVEPDPDVVVDGVPLEVWAEFEDAACLGAGDGLPKLRMVSDIGISGLL